MVQGILKQWRTGCWMIYDATGQRNNYLDTDSIIEVELDGRWKRVSWKPGPGGMHPFDDGKSIPEMLHARLIDPSQKVVPIRR